jgi:4-hydroxythreonine-4-phosphate dehydrogenase
MGDPAGIGPEVIMKTLASPAIRGLAVFVIAGDKNVIGQAASIAGISAEELAFHPDPGPRTSGLELKEKCINVIDPGPELDDMAPGRPTDAGARKSLACIDLAIHLVRDAQNDTPKAIVTAPVCKEAIANIHPGFVGHTEYLQEAFSVKFVTMAMVGERFSVIPVTRHIPIKDVASSLSVDLISGTLEQVIQNRSVISGKDDPRISVAALNPHSGEGGKIGKEENDIIRPAVERAKAVYGPVEGPISADVVFYRALKKDTDIVVSMYHDQGLAPFKMVEFDTGVNMTLGLGHVRTSPDHGTAFDIAGKGVAGTESMQNAVKLAVRAITNR